MDELINLIKKVSIENINETDINSNYFEFTELSIELDNLEYINIRKNALISNVIEWIESNKNHTFPKRKHGWINAFRTQNNLLKTEIKYTPEQIINNILLKKTPKYMEHICKKVYKIITNFNYTNKNIYSGETTDLLKKIKIWCSLILDVDPTELYNILVENNIIFIKGKYSILNKDIKIKNKKRKFDDSFKDDIEYSSLDDITNKVKKIKNL